MEPAIPWYQSAIIRQQIVAFIIAALGLLKFTTDIDIDATVAAVFAGIAAIIPVYTIFTRLFKPSPNLTATAANKEAQLKASGDIKTTTLSAKQGGFFRLSMAVFVALFAVGAASLLPGCASTAAAYKAASSLPDTAYVVTEHYAAVVKEAADLAEIPTTSPEVKAALKKAATATAPFVLGDPATGKPSLRSLAEHYAAVKDAKSEAELQAALNSAVTELAKLINAVKSARS